MSGNSTPDARPSSPSWRMISVILFIVAGLCLGGGTAKAQDIKNLYPFHLRQLVSQIQECQTPVQAGRRTDGQAHEQNPAVPLPRLCVLLKLSAIPDENRRAGGSYSAQRLHGLHREIAEPGAAPA